MHSAHRDLETKYKRTKADLVQALQDKETYMNAMNVKIDEITDLKTKKSELESKLSQANEKIEVLSRDLKLKND
jgi:predicted  nucleic acid-binding Zn-ribbon protein